MTRPTICAECRHFIYRHYAVFDDCAVRPDIRFVSGAPVYAKCVARNQGKCPDFEPKPLPWWRRLFGGRK